MECRSCGEPMANEAPFCAACGAPVPPPASAVEGGAGTPATLGELQRSLATYADACVGCHGMQGSGNLGPRLNPNPTVARLTDADLRQVIEQGKGDQMPGWQGRLTSEDVESVIALLRSWQ